MKIESAEAQKKYGITTSHEIMDNGELRFRLRSGDGSAYIRTVSGDSGEWQNSHYHKDVLETYIVQKEWMAIAELDGAEMKIKIYKEDEIVTTRKEIAHNVYLPSAAVIHTIKHGNSIGQDWYSSISLDKRTKNLTETEILKIASSR